MRKIFILFFIPFIFLSCEQYKENKEKKRLEEIRIDDINRFAEEIKAMVLSDNPPENINISHRNSLNGVLFYGYTTSVFNYSLMKIKYFPDDKELLITKINENNDSIDVTDVRVPYDEIVDITKKWRYSTYWDYDKQEYILEDLEGLLIFVDNRRLNFKTKRLSKEEFKIAYPDY